MFLNNRKTSIGDVISVVNRLSVDQEEPTKNINKQKKKKKLPLTKRIFAKILASKNRVLRTWQAQNTPYPPWR